jgi:RNA polymerase sigma-B factor
MNLNSSSFQQSEMNDFIQQYQQTNSNEIATKLIMYYQPIVKMAAGKMSRNKPDLYEDLFQVGQMSMLRLFQTFDSSMGIPFEAYAMKSIIGHLKNYLRDKSWFIKVPRRIKEKGLLIQHAVDELTVKLERSPRMEEISNYLELTVEETIEIMAGRESYNYISLDTPLSNDEDSSTIGDLMGSQANDYQSFEMRADLEQALIQLKKDERIIIFLAYNEGQSQRQIAEQLGVSQMSVSRIQKRAISKLKELLADQNLSAFLD